MIFLIAIGLAVDCTTVAIAAGTQLKKFIFKNALKASSFFGVFHIVLLFLGFQFGFTIKIFIQNIDHWIAFILFSIIGIKMICDSCKKSSSEIRTDFFSTSTLLVLSLATSIDAFIVGVSFAFLSTSIIYASLIVGITTFLFSLVGFFIGSKLEGVFGKKMEIIGGVILIFMGISILLKHLFY